MRYKMENMLTIKIILYDKWNLITYFLLLFIVGITIFMSVKLTSLLSSK